MFEVFHAKAAQLIVRQGGDDFTKPYDTHEQAAS
jgi:hypothetical protein